MAFTYGNMIESMIKVTKYGGGTLLGVYLLNGDLRNAGIAGLVAVSANLVDSAISGIRLDNARERIKKLEKTVQKHQYNIEALKQKE